MFSYQLCWITFSGASRWQKVVSGPHEHACKTACSGARVRVHGKHSTTPNLSPKYSSLFNREIGVQPWKNRHFLFVFQFFCRRRLDRQRHIEASPRTLRSSASPRTPSHATCGGGCRGPKCVRDVASCWRRVVRTGDCWRAYGALRHVVRDERDEAIDAT